MSVPPSAEEIRGVARKAVTAFTTRGLDCCLFGSAGCALYGNSRTPNDVDLVVMTNDYDPEVLKEFLAKQPRLNFYLIRSKKVGATYKILYARLSPSLYSSRRRCCKVDILVPGVLNIPFIANTRIVHIDDLPVMPLIALLLLKLQGWSDHRASPRSDMQQKQYVDVRDINQLLAVAAQRGEHIGEATWLPQSLKDATLEQLGRFIDVLRPAQRELWEQIGYNLV